MRAGTGLLMVVLGALTCIPAIGVQAGVGNGGSSVPPGLLVAQQKTWDAFTRQIAKEEARYDAKVAPLEAQVLALWPGYAVDPPDLLSYPTAPEDQLLVEEFLAEIDALTAKHDAKIARLEQKRADKWAMFDAKMAAFLLKHAAAGEEGPDPAE